MHRNEIIYGLICINSHVLLCQISMLSASMGEANLSNSYSCTRPDITYVVSVLSQFMHEPLMMHWEGALRVLAYIKRPPGKGLIYRHHDHLRIEAYSNARYVGDKGDQKSTT